MKENEMLVEDNINANGTQYTLWEKDSKLPRTLLKGTKGMIIAGQEFLPKFQMESPEAYENRLSTSILLNAFGKTCSFLTGQVFQKKLVFGDDIPDTITEWNNDIDTMGNPIDIFARRVFYNGLGKGVSHILVDSSQEAGSMSVAEANAAGVRPYFKEVMPESIFAWITDEYNHLAQVRIREARVVRVGMYGSALVPCIRVIEPGSWQVWTMNEKGSEYSLTDEGTYPDGVLPLFTFIPGKEMSRLTGESPLMDLAYLNVHHWRSYSDQINILHIVRQAFLMSKHIDVKAVPIGGSSIINSNEDNADMKYVEHSGKAIESGFKDLEETQEQMSMYGLQQLVSDPGSVTATAKSIDTAQSSSSLGAWATDFEDFLQNAYDCLALFGGVEFPADGVRVNQEFNMGAYNDSELNAILKAEDQRIVSAQRVFTEFVRRGVFDDINTWEDNAEEIENEERSNLDMAALAGDTFENTENV